MERTEFLEKKIFVDLTNINNGPDKDTVHYFSESDFEILLKRVEHFGIGIYGMESWLNDALYGISGHEDYKKKATDPKWYNKAFLTFKIRQTGLSFTATYKVPVKLLAR